jgi:hypothetical protein
MKFRIFFLVCAFLIVPFQGVFSQSIQNEVVASSGDSYYFENFEISWTVGESIIESYQSGDILVSQGFHQPIDGFVGVPEQDKPDFQVSVFPNPTKRYILVELAGSSELENFKLILCDMMGKELLYRIYYQDTQNRIDLAEFSQGIFVLKIIRENDSRQRTFKIVKTAF